MISTAAAMPIHTALQCLVLTFISSVYWVSTLDFCVFVGYSKATRSRDVLVVTPQHRGVPTTSRRDSRRGFRQRLWLRLQLGRKHRNTTPLRETSLAWSRVFAVPMPCILTKYATCYLVNSYPDSLNSIQAHSRLVVDQLGQITTASVVWETRHRGR